MGLRLLADRIAIRPDEAATTSKGGIELIAPEKVAKGTIVYVGPGKFDDKGNFNPVSVNVGDHISYMNANAEEIELEDETLLILTEDAILAVHV
jgi:chaperonin GroES